MSSDRSYPPFVSPRSPTYERAWSDFLHPAARNHSGAIAVMAELYDAEQNASAALGKLSTLLADKGLAEVVRDRAALHDARRSGVGKAIEQLGGSASSPAGTRIVLARALDAASNADSDPTARQALALVTNELKAVYDRAVQNENLDPQQRSALSLLAPADAVED